MKLIGITGKAGAGKDTAANMISHTVFSLATPIKTAAAVIFGLPIKNFYDQSLKEVVDEHWNMSPRSMIQLLGTEACRGAFGDDIWLRSMEKIMTLSTGIDKFVIADIRFENEADWLRGQGGQIVHIVRPNQQLIKTDSHTSEAGVEVKEQDIVIMNKGTLNDLNAALILKGLAV